jgi:UDP-N-acetylglucosamine 2-epimerase (non-hydrolysing)
MRVVTIVGTRPELIKLSRVIAELDRRFEHLLCHTGQNYDYELNGVFFEELEIRRPDRFLEIKADGSAAFVAGVIKASDELLAETSPDALLILGDTNSCLCAYAAKRRKIPIFHMEAGNRCFDFRVPEEVNRRIVDHLSDVNLPYTEHARRNLLAEGLPPDRTIVTGSPMREVLEHYSELIAESRVLEEMGLEQGRYFLLSCHREENVDSPDHLSLLNDSLHRLSGAYELPIIFSLHPRTKKRMAVAGLELPANVVEHKPFGFPDYVALQKNAFCVLSDSGTLTEESALLGFPAVMLRQAHERPEGMDEACVIMSGLDPGRVIESVQAATDPESAGLRPPRDYEPDNVSRKVARIILSYTDFVNRTVWRKSL